MSDRDCQHRAERACDRCADAAEIEQLRAEIERLNSAVRYEQHLAERVGTHGPGCETWGPAHYECAVREIERLNAGRHELQAQGTHPAPCARHCESTAYEIEIRRLRAELAAIRDREARMREALWQLLDDMGETRLCVCSAAKDQARAALAEGAQG